MVREYRATMPEAFSWESQVHQYQDAPPPPVETLPCITYYAGDVPDAEPVDCLLYWIASRSGRPMIVGILNHYGRDYPPWESAGNVNIFVRGPNQRQGIATRLWLEAVDRWQVRLDRQRFTPSGAAAVNHALRKERKGEEL